MAKQSKKKAKVRKVPKHYRCGICSKLGHNTRTCTKKKR